MINIELVRSIIDTYRAMDTTFKLLYITQDQIQLSLISINDHYTHRSCNHYIVSINLTPNTMVLVRTVIKFANLPTYIVQYVLNCVELCVTV